MDGEVAESMPIQEMISSRDSFQERANDLKKRRDELHEKSKLLTKDRDELNAKIRQVRNQINVHKKKRDEYNERVKHAKEQRNKLLKSHADMKKIVKDLEKERKSASGVDISSLKLSLRKMENEQMTQPMSPQKEKKLIEAIKELHKKIKHEEEILNTDPKLKKAIEEEKLLKQKAEKQHDLVEKLAKKAQEEHQSMIDLLKQLDIATRKNSDIQENIVLTKIEADKVHKEFIDYVNKIHDLEKNISSVEKKKDKRKKIADASAVQKEADEIYERFKKGEKLSTEDLMILQKAGLL